MALFPRRSARALWQAGDRARDARRWQEARVSYAEALKLAPSRYGLWVQYGNVAKEAGELAEAESAYRTALILDPDKPQAHLELAHLLKRTGRGGESIRHFEKVQKLDASSDVASELATVRALDGADRKEVSVSAGAVERFADYEIALRNVRTLGYALARVLGQELNERKVDRPPAVELASKPCTQADMEGDWVAYWARELKSSVRYHRKLWEFCYLAQSLWHAGKLKPGAKGLGFACGDEPVLGLFARLGAHVESLDLPAIPQSLHGGFDFCWSACSLDPLGSIEGALQFFEASLRALKPGGVAAHVVEFHLDDRPTDASRVLFQRKHILDLRNRLEQRGYRVANLDFDAGDGFLDGFVDLPPWPSAERPDLPEPDAHLKISLDGCVCTSFGLTVFAPGG